MTKVVADISVSLDGYVTDPDGGVEDLHRWVFSDDPVDAEVVRRATAESGAVVMGRRLFDIVDAPDGWNEDIGYGARETGNPPFFVVTHSPPADVRLARDLGMSFTFVDGVAAAIDAARGVAGDRHVVVMGGGDVIGQAVEEGLLDELRLHLAPVVLGGGTPLFQPGTRAAYRQRDVRPSAHAVHLTYERA